MSTTPNMGMLLPTVSATPGPLYASENNQAFLVVDQHDHSSGNGIPVPSNGISINGDLPFNGFNATLLRSTRYSNQSAPLALAADVSSIYTVGGNLYWNNGIGQPIQITAGAALNASSIGGIGGDYSTSTASLFYTSAQSTFTFWSAANTSASIDSGPITIRNNTLNSFGVTISANPSISANFGLTIFQSLPASTKIVTVDASGNIGDVYDVDNSTIAIISNIIQVPAQGITATQIANQTITATQIANTTVSSQQMNIPGPTVFSTSGSYTVPANVTKIHVIACGGGGGGTGGSGGSGGGGGAGAAVFEGTVTVIPGDVLTVTVGTGGAGGGVGVSGGTGGATFVTGTGITIETNGANGGIITGLQGGAGQRGTQNGTSGGNATSGSPGAGGFSYLSLMDPVANGGTGTTNGEGGGGGSIGVGGWFGVTNPGIGGGGCGGTPGGSGQNGGDGQVTIFTF